MGFYTNRILPHLIELSMRNPEMSRLRAEWVAQAYGEVLESGIGSGLNLAHYGSRVSRVYGVDPSAPLQTIARKRAAAVRFEVGMFHQPAESPLPLRDESIDTVVLTWTLCSIPKPAEALAEMKRVLRADGALIFIEHGRSPDADVARWQDRLTPVWTRIAGGCHLNRDIDHLIEAAGFEIHEAQTFYLSGPRMMTYTYKGLARRARSR
jgi:ubiquinone/menaquinone biosynthesis C-methylase UbiE